MTRTSSMPFLALSCIVLGCFLVSAGCTLFQSSNQKTVNSSVVLQVPATTAEGAQTFPSGGAATTQCSSGMTSCRGNCVNTQSDHDNCGGCNNICSTGQACQNGLCTGQAVTAPAGNVPAGSVPAGTASCATGQTSCSGDCVNTLSDHDNCGSCGNACSAGQVCQNSQCTSTGGSVQCSTGQTPCSGSCVDTRTAFYNCGACGHSCSSGQICTSGSCTEVSASAVGSNTAFCLVGQTTCSGTCVDTKSDKNNCGSCGKKCSSGQVCTSGSCTAVSVGGSNTGFCLVGQTTCSGACVDTRTDTANCGACAKKCQSGESCSQGKCLSWTGTWRGTGGYALHMDQAGTSVKGQQYDPSGSFALSGFTSSTPPKLSCTWFDQNGQSGSCEFTMASDGNTFTGWIAAGAGEQNKKYLTGTRS